MISDIDQIITSKDQSKESKYQSKESKYQSKDPNNLPIYLISCHGRVIFNVETHHNELDDKLYIKTENYEDNYLCLRQNQYVIQSSPLGCDSIVNQSKSNSDDLLFTHLLNSKISGEDFLKEDGIFDIHHKRTTKHLIHNEFNSILTKINELKEKLRLTFEDYSILFTDDIYSNYEKANIALTSVSNWMPSIHNEYYLEFKYLLDYLKEVIEKLNPVYKDILFKNIPKFQIYNGFENQTILNKDLEFYDDDDEGSFNMGIFEFSERNRENMMALCKNTRLVETMKNYSQYDRINRTVNLNNFSLHSMNLREKSGEKKSRYIFDKDKNYQICNLLLNSVNHKTSIKLSQIINILGEGIFICLNCSPLSICDYTQDPEYIFNYILPYKLFYKSTKFIHQDIYKKIVKDLTKVLKNTKNPNLIFQNKKKYKINVAIQQFGLI